MSEKTQYEGSRTIDGIVVTCAGVPLETQDHIECFCAAGFEWGYYGDAARQLAFALLMHHTNDREQSLALTDAFARDVISILDNDWVLSPKEITAFIKANSFKG